MVEVLVGHSSNRVEHGCHELLDVLQLPRVPIKLWEVSLNIRGLDLIFEQICLVEKYDDDDLSEASIVDYGLENVDTFN